MALARIDCAVEVETLVLGARADVGAALVCLSQRGLRVGPPDADLQGPRVLGVVEGSTGVWTGFRGGGHHRRLRAPDPQSLRGQTAHQLGDRIRGHGQPMAAKGLVTTVYSGHDYRIHRDIDRLKQLLGHSELHNAERYLRSLNLIAEG